MKLLIVQPTTKAFLEVVFKESEFNSINFAVKRTPRTLFKSGAAVSITGLLGAVSCVRSLIFRFFSTSLIFDLDNSGLDEPH
ncbi:unnamed protein product [Schistosoma rodhaini]|nr:unnamed protein product [Schistosoma rodhaini]